MSKLLKYDAAKAAVLAAKSYDEVKDIRDKAAAMAEYARLANDTEMIEWTTEIRVRAERRAGQMLAEMPKQGPGEYQRSQAATVAPTLSEIGISKTDSSRWQKLAAVDDAQFELAVEAAKETAGRVTQAAILKATAPEARPEPRHASPGPPARPSGPCPNCLEAQRAAENLNRQLETYVNIVEADDQLKAANDEIKRLKDLNRILEERNQGLMAEKNELIKALKAAQRGKK